MHRKQAAARIPKPRNPVVLAAIRRIAGMGGGMHRRRNRATRQDGRKDLDRRVREIGEW